MLRSLKKELKDLVAKPGGDIFRRLKQDVLESESNLYNDLIVIEARYNELQRSGVLGVIHFENKDVTFNSVNEALIWIIGSIGLNDLSSSCRKEITEQNQIQNQDHKEAGDNLLDHHIYTCDRKVHTSHFKNLNKGASGNTHFYYLYGGNRQSIEGFFYRLAYELDGRLLDHNNPGYKASCESVPIYFTCNFYDDLENDKEELVKNLFANFKIPVNEQEPLGKKNLADVFSESPTVQDLQPHDYVCVLMIMSEFDWNAKITPILTKWFIEQFCNIEYDAEAPSFYFFFGIEYDESNDEIKDEIGAALSKAEYIQPLPELNMVPFKDIGRWFAKHRDIEKDGGKRQQMMETHFEKGGRFYMVNVEEKLKLIIDQFNNKKLIK